MVAHRLARMLQGAGSILVADFVRLSTSVIRIKSSVFFFSITELVESSAATIILSC